ncbi:CGNR zinc finger domain-containing protein [Kribbella sp. DT2]|uniref:CGNR zinc finger domain-containing protein n=1 Tax=Kribbella sp. DT2 TaxID=3393427 RepID=UPI003CF13C31
MSYAPELVGGHVVLDLINTVSWRLDPSRWVDRIAEPEARDVWLRAVELGQVEAGDLAALRETAYEVLQPLAVGEEPDNVAELRELLVAAVGRARIVQLNPLRWQADDAVTELTLAAWRLLEDEDLSRLRQCQDNDCGWLFLDRSKNGSRRWCSSGDCGNRARAKRHYQRTREGGR